MAKSEGVVEPSMDEILTSIRKIIAEDEVDDSSATAAASERQPTPPAQPTPADDDADDILELTEDDEDDGAELVEAEVAEADADVFDDVAAEPDGSRPLATDVDAPSPSEAPVDDAPMDVSEADGQADGAEVEPAPAEVEVEGETAVAAEAQPAATERAAVMMNEMTEVLLDNGAATAASSALQRLSAAVAPGEAVPQGHRTIEAFLADLVRPEIKGWLDDHLPALVERIVEREIKRLVRDSQPE